MSERLDVCQALAAMMRQAGEPSVEEVKFVGYAAMALGLDDDENAKLVETLKGGGDFAAHLKEVTSKPMQQFLFRRVVAATLIDEQISAAEQAFIDETAKAFGFKPDVVKRFVEWMKEGIDWEKRGAELIAQL